MKVISLSTSLFIVLLFSFVTSIQQVSASPVDTYEFRDEVTKVRFQALSKELRCPKCQNQNLADSNSPIASDLRKELYELLQQGKADSEIVTFMVNRYGEFVLYRPRVSSLTYVLWFGPAVLIFFGFIIVMIIVRRKPVAKENLQLTAEQQEALKKALNEK